MGMIGNYLRVSADELQEFLEDSSKLEDRIYRESDEEDPNLIDVDKAWNGIFYLLTGHPLDTGENAPGPLAWVIFGPNQVDPDQDLGYGPAYYTDVAQTKEVHAALSLISTPELLQRYDAKKMTDADIYPQIWDEGDDAKEYIGGYFENLKAFYEKAAAGSQAVLVFVN